MTILCTLFNANYLDKGLTMYESLEKVSNDFKLYVLAMDDRCYDILRTENRKHIIPIKLSDFENEKLLKVKNSRSLGEYCWTCSSSLIKYIFEKYNPDYCAYIDADLYFYSDPSVIVEEMKNKNASVQITGHRFNKYEEKSKSRIVGKYCVEYNTFKNDDNGNKLLNIWINQCIEHCSIDGDGKYWGDQKYMDNWIEDYNFVIETKEMGLGVAPWNINQYKSVKNKFPTIKHNGKDINLIMYHFENIQYYNINTIKLNVYARWGVDDKLINMLYYPYLKHINLIKEHIKNKYNLDILITHHPGVKQIKRNRKSFLKRVIDFSKNFKTLLYYKIPLQLFKNKDIINLY